MSPERGSAWHGDQRDQAKNCEHHRRRRRSQPEASQSAEQAPQVAERAPHGGIDLSADPPAGFRTGGSTFKESSHRTTEKASNRGDRLLVPMLCTTPARYRAAGGSGDGATGGAKDGTYAATN